MYFNVTMDRLREPVRNLFGRYRAHLDREPPPDIEPTIQVDEIASKIAAFYEQVRNLIDYHESHLLRKNVIARSLHRRIFLKDISGEAIAEPLLKELIRSGYLGNRPVPERLISEVQRLIDTLLFLLERIPHHTGDRTGRETAEWLIGIAVCAIEEIVAPPTQDTLLTDCMFRTVEQHLTVTGGALSPNDREALLFIAVQKALFRVDRDQLSHRLFSFIYPHWRTLPSHELTKLGEELPKIRAQIEAYENHPLLPSFLKLCNHYNIVFLIIGDLIFGGAGLDDLDKKVIAAYRARYAREKSKLFRLAFFSVISFFFSKVLVALAIEIPIDRYLFHGISLVHTAANIVFPPLLMLIIVSSIRLPSERNEDLVAQEARAAAFAEYEPAYTIALPRPKSASTQIIVQLFYLFIFGISLYYLALLLLALGFSTANIVVFVFFTSLVTATGVKIYNRSREISLEKPRSRFFTFLIDIFTIPLVTIGRQLIAGLRRFNVLVLLFNFVIEAPFQFFIEFLEHFNDFIRRKKEEVE